MAANRKEDPKNGNKKIIRISALGPTNPEIIGTIDIKTSPGPANLFCDYASGKKPEGNELLKASAKCLQIQNFFSERISYKIAFHQAAPPGLGISPAPPRSETTFTCIRT